MARHKMVNGQRVDFTDAEEAEWDAKEKAFAAEAPTRGFATLRQNRDMLLAQCDWMAGSDVTMTDAWKTYRQELRDLPSKYDNSTVVGTITYPTKPE